jgi:hypothetical protein
MKREKRGREGRGKAEFERGFERRDEGAKRLVSGGGAGTVRVL